MDRHMALGWPPFSHMVKRLVIANVALWFASVILIVWVESGALASLYAHLRLETAPGAARSVWSGEVWQVFTYMWLHDLSSPMHVAFNMLMLWMFGGALERRWGARVFAKFYMICGVGAGIVSALAGAVAPGLFGYPIVGASGAVLGLLSATSLVFPNQTILLAFIFPIPSRYLAAIAAVLDIALFLSGSNDFAIAAHLGGLLTGYLLVTGLWRPTSLRDRILMLKRRWQRRHLRAVPRDDSGRGPWVH